MGVLLYEMLCGNWPFSAKNESELARKIKAKDFKFDSSIQITEEMKNLVSRMLEFEEGNPQTKTGRILLEDIFKHPAVTNSLQIDLSVQPQD
jgi:serine/threonine protein kinase